MVSSRWQNEDQPLIVLREGEKGQIHRLCEQVGLKVVGVKRIRISPIVFWVLRVGQWRY